MGTQITFEIEGDKQISAELGVAIEGLQDFSIPMAAAADIMETAVEDNFEGRGKRFGGWAPRKPQYRGGVRIDTHPLLEKTGAMRKAFIKDSGKDYAMVTNEDKKFPYHQSNQPRTKIPRRVMLMIDDRMREEIFKAFQLYIVTILRGDRP